MELLKALAQLSQHHLADSISKPNLKSKLCVCARMQCECVSACVRHHQQANLFFKNIYQQRKFKYFEFFFMVKEAIRGEEL
jgi:hypothetical protein